MARMTDYFRYKLGKVLARRVPTKSGITQYEYVAEVIQARQTNVAVNVSRRTFSSAGPRLAGENVYLGDHLVGLSQINGLEDFWRALICIADPEMANKIILPKPTDPQTTPDLELLEE